MALCGWPPAGLPLLPGGACSGYVVSASGGNAVLVEYELGCAATQRDPATTARSSPP